MIEKKEWILALSDGDSPGVHKANASDSDPTLTLRKIKPIGRRRLRARARSLALHFDDYSGTPAGSAGRTSRMFGRETTKNCVAFVLFDGTEWVIRHPRTYPRPQAFASRDDALREAVSLAAASLPLDAALSRK
jgi:hypothetical protein